MGKWIKSITKFIYQSTIDQIEEVHAINNRKILEVDLKDGSQKHYWNNYYNFNKITASGKQIKLK